MNRPFVNGNREQTNNFTVDGLDVNETIDNRVAYQPIPDALAEISVETNNYARRRRQRRRRRRSTASSNRGRTSSTATPSSSTGTATSTRTRGRTTGRARPSRSGQQHIFGGTFGGPIVTNKLFFFGDYQGSRQDAPGFGDRLGGAGSVAPRRPVERERRRSAIRSRACPFPGNQIPAEQNQPDRPRDPERPRRTTRCRTAPCRAGSPATLSARRCSPSAPTRATCASTGARRTTTSSSAATRSPSTRTGATSSRSRSFLTSRNDQPFHNVGFNWNRVFGSSMINELLVGYSNTTVTAGDVRLGRRRRRQRDLRDRRRTADRRPQLDRMGQRAHRARGDRDRLGYARQDLSDQREGDLDQGPPHGQVRRAVAALQPARFYAGNNGLLGFINFNGAFTGFAFSDFLLDLVSEQGPGRRRPERPVDAPAELASRSSPGRLQGPAEPDAEPGPALGVHVAARREGQSPVELRSRHRPADLRAGRQHRRARALPALLQRLRAARRRRVDAQPTPRLPRRLRHHAVHGGHGREPAAAAQPAVLLRVGGQLRPARRARDDPDRVCGAGAGNDTSGKRARLRSATSARSSPSSGTRSSSTS